MYNLFTETYEIARKIEKEAADISTSEEGRFKNLNQSKDLKRRLIKKPRFHDELDDDNCGNYISFFFIIVSLLYCKFNHYCRSYKKKISSRANACCILYSRT